MNDLGATHNMYWKEYRFARRRGDRLGPLIGGLVVVWLGVSLYLAETVSAVSAAWWAYFLIGLGVILIVSGLVRWVQYSYRYPPTGFLVGGLFLLVIGLAGVVSAAFFGPGLLIAIGVVIIVFGAYSIRRRAPPQNAQPPTSA
jgi:hypothetical protein